MRLITLAVAVVLTFAPIFLQNASAEPQCPPGKCDDGDCVSCSRMTDAQCSNALRSPRSNPSQVRCDDGTQCRSCGGKRFSKVNGTWVPKGILKANSVQIKTKAKGKSGLKTMGQKLRYCRGYGRSSRAQQLQNIRLRCRFRGHLWHSNYSVHYRSCVKSSLRSSAYKVRRRAMALRGCARRAKLLKKKAVRRR